MPLWALGLPAGNQTSPSPRAVSSRELTLCELFPVSAARPWCRPLGPACPHLARLLPTLHLSAWGHRVREGAVQPLLGDGESKAQAGPRWPLVLEDRAASGLGLLHPRVLGSASGQLTRGWPIDEGLERLAGWPHGWSSHDWCWAGRQQKPGLGSPDGRRRRAVGLQGAVVNSELVSEGQKGSRTGAGEGTGRKVEALSGSQQGCRWWCHGEARGQSGHGAGGRFDLDQGERERQGKSLVSLLGAVGSPSMILSGRVTWAAVPFGKGKLGTEQEVGRPFRCVRTAALALATSTDRCSFTFFSPFNEFTCHK